jgi:hypothetical protein
MTSTQYPEGPWLLDTGRPRRKTIVARTYSEVPGAPRYIEIADVLDARVTRLLLAAPELLEALQSIVARVDDSSDEPSLTMLDAVHDIALIAINKAEGHES